VEGDVRLLDVGVLLFEPGAGKQKPGLDKSHCNPAAQHPPAGHFVSVSEHAAEQPGIPLASTTHYHINIIPAGRSGVPVIPRDNTLQSHHYKK